MGGYYDPPFKCRVPISAKKPHEARWDKGLWWASSRRLFSDFSATFQLNFGNLYFPVMLYSIRIMLYTNKKT